MTTKSILLACSVAAALLGTAPVRAENLIEVYLDAVRSDPLVREAEARRSAALELKPQARGLLLPQVNLGGQVYTANSDGESTFPQVNQTTGNIVTVGNKSSTDVSQYLGLPRRTDPDRIPVGPVAGTEARRFAGSGGRGDVSRCAAGSARARRAGVFRRAGGRGHARRRTGDARCVQPAARAGREAFRSRPDRRHGRAGIAGRPRQRDGGRHRRQAHARDLAGSTARTHRQGLQVAGEAGRTDAAQQAGSGERAGVGRPCARQQPQRDRGAPEFGSGERQRQGGGGRPHADGRSLCPVQREQPRRDADEPVVRPVGRPRRGRPRGRLGRLEPDQRRDRPAREHPDLQWRRDAVARA